MPTRKQMTTLNPLFKQRIKELRYTQSGLANSNDMHPVTLCQYIGGQKVRYLHEGIIAIGRVLGLEPAECFVEPTPRMSASPALPSVPAAGTESAGPPCQNQ